MTKINANQFLWVKDAKHPAQDNRLGIINVEENVAFGTSKPSLEVHFEELRLIGWPSKLDLPNDLEGICPLPNRVNEYFAVESGFYPRYGSFGRIIHFRLNPTYQTEEYLGWRNAEFVSCFEPFSNTGVETPVHEEIEGIAAVSHLDRTWLLFGLRGDLEAKKSAKLVWGNLSFQTDFSFHEQGRDTLISYDAADRGCSDLLLVDDKGFNSSQDGHAKQWKIFSAMTNDPGDLGPFKSAIFLAGHFRVDNNAVASFIPVAEPKRNVWWHVDGLKVEALSLKADLIPSSAISIATDDETFEGIWRPLPPAEKVDAKASKMLVFASLRSSSKNGL